LIDAIESRQYEISVTVGCGGTFFKNEKVTLGDLMAAADMAMLQSLSSGDSRLVLLDYPTEDKNERKGSLFWKQLIVNALNENQFALLAQPVIAFNDSSRLQYEVVGRLINVDGELIPASQFMPMAIRHNLNASVDLKLMEKIFQVMGTNNVLTNQIIAINLSIRSINDSNLIAWLTSTLTKHPQFAHKVVFEFSEFGVVHNLSSMDKFVENIRGLGSNFAVDNFGLHHSAFDYLKTLRPAYIKLSPVFITDLLQNQANQFFISSVVKITKPLEIQIFAHSIENEAVLEILKTLGVDGYQGFATGTPIRID
jgi:EAL domain-containing protein (putative c-di-GMP-specific phosphodiesterase class I)